MNQDLNDESIFWRNGNTLANFTYMMGKTHNRLEALEMMVKTFEDSQDFSNRVSMGKYLDP